MRRPHSVHRFDVLLIVALVACIAPVAAQDVPLPAAAAEQDHVEPQTEPPPRAPASDAIAYRLIVDGPNPPANAIRDGLDLARWQDDTEMTLDLLERLVREAVPQAQEIAAIEGFYEAKIDIAIDRNTRPFEVRVRVEPGAPSRVSSVNIDVTGPAVTDAPAGTQAIRELRDGWSLRLGDVFRQADWIDAKARALRTLRRSPYPAARIVESEARVEPQRLTADLTVDIASGPPFRIGALDVQGTKRYPKSLVENFSTFERGEPYTEAAIDAYVRRLSSSGYFSSAQASIDPESATPDDATVRVAVIEAPTHRVEGGISYSTDTEFGANAAYTNVNIDGNATQMRIDGRYENRQQLANLTFTRPPTDAQWIDALKLGAQRTDFQNTVETTAGIGLSRRGIDERNHWIFSAAYYFDRQEPKDAPITRAHATYLEAGYVIRRADDLVSPTRGWMADLRLGGGIPGISTAGFTRAVAQGAAWYPINRDIGLAFRGDIGAVFGASREDVPSILRFRTGGDTTVRGYEYQSLGVAVGDAIVGGRYYAVASVEIIRWINETWGIAGFVDAGDAADSFSDLEIALGYGIGARLRTPIGPFRLDLAYGEETGKIRLHFSVGISF